MNIKKFFLFVLLAMVFFGSGFLFGWNNHASNRDFTLNLVHQSKPFYVNGIARIPAVFDGFSGDVVIFTDSKGQKHELSTSGLTLPVQYWAALDNDLDVPISKDSFIVGAKIIVTLGVDINTGKIGTVWLELDKSRS